MIIVLIQKDLFKSINLFKTKIWAFNVKEKFNSSIGVSVTGIAGPDGGSEAKPVGLVYIGVKKGNKIQINKCLFKSKKRSSIQRATVKKALGLILRIAK